MVKLTSRSLYILGATNALLLLSGCDHISKWSQSKEVVLPTTPPIASESLAQVAGTCKKDVERLSERSAYVPEERQKEFRTVLGLAEDNCDEMVETFTRLKAATYQEQSFRQNLQHAEATIVRGASMSSEPISSGIKEEPIGGFDQPLQDDALGQDFSNEPLK